MTRGFRLFIRARRFSLRIEQIESVETRTLFNAADRQQRSPLRACEDDDEAEIKTRALRKDGISIQER